MTKRVRPSGSSGTLGTLRDPRDPRDPPAPMTCAHQFVGALSRKSKCLLEFIAVYGRNGSSRALPTDRAERHRELTRRATRIEPMLTKPFGMANTADFVKKEHAVV